MTDRSGTAAVAHTFAVIPAGGIGSRLWPVSQPTRPKFLLDLTGTGRSLLQGTWDRLVATLPPERIIVVTGAAHADAVREQLPDLDDANVILEPEPRDSSAAIGLAAAVIADRDPEGIAAVFPADHLIDNRTGFRAALVEAVAVAREGRITTIGISPDEPSTAYGYIHMGAELGGDHPRARRAVEFVEKPDASRAAAYVRDLRHVWNAGIYIAPAGLLLERLEHFDPSFADLRSLGADVAGGAPIDPERWGKIRKIALDYSVSEPSASAGLVAVVPADLGWTDLGDWQSVLGAFAATTTGSDDTTPDDVTVVGDADGVFSVHSTGLVVSTTGRPVAVLGLSNVIVVDTPEGVLVMAPDHAQRVRDASGWADGRATR